MLKLKNTNLPSFIISTLLVLSGVFGFILSTPNTTYAASPPFGCPGGPIGPGAPQSCPFTLAEVSQFCANPSSLPPGQTVFCSNGQGGVTEINNTSAPVNPGGPGGGGGSDNSSSYSQPCEAENVDKSNCGIIAYLVDFINILSGLVGIVVVISLVFWGIQYTTARDNPQQAATARLRILQTVLSLIAYLFVFAFLQWLVPGGVF